MRYLSLLLLLINTVWGNSQALNIKNFATPDGLSHSEILDIESGPYGFLWIATRGGGLNKFDGKNFEVYTNFDGLPNNSILDIYFDQNDLLWLATEDGLSRYNGVSFKNFRAGDDGKPFVVTGISEYQNQIFIASNRGFYSVKDDSLIPFTTDIKVPFNAIGFIKKSEKKGLWIANGSQLYFLNGKKSQKFDESHGLLRHPLSDLVEYDDKLYISHFNGGILELGADGVLKKIDETSELQNKYINCLHVFENKLYVGTNNSGLYSYDLKTNELQLLNENKGISTNHIECLYSSPNGDILWVGTGGGGLSKIYKSTFTPYKIPNEQEDNPWIYDCIYAKDGAIWVGAGAKGVYSIKDSSTIQFNSSNGYTSAKTRIIYEDKDGRILFAPEGKGLWLYDSLFHQLISPERKMRFDHIKGITQDSSNNYWISEGGKGLMRFKIEDSTYKVIDHKIFNRTSGLPRNYIYDLFTDRNGRVWFGTRNAGAGVIEDNHIYLLNTQNGLASNFVTSITEDFKGQIYLAGGNAISIISGDKGKWKIHDVLSRESKLKGHQIFQILVDSGSGIWVGTTHGMNYYQFNGKGDGYNYEYFGPNEGFTAMETNTNALCMLPNGKILSGTPQGLFVYHPEVKSKNFQKPQIFLKDIKVFYEPLKKLYPNLFEQWNQVKSKVHLNHKQTHLSFEFTAQDLSNPDNIQYAWFLEGFDEKWSPFNDQTIAVYSNLPPGKYSFHLKAINNDGISSDEFISHSIIINAPPPPPPPFYKQVWFIYTIIALSALIIGLVLFIIIQRWKRERERIRMERNVLHLQQQTLRLQMNPHFIFNALNTIQGKIVQQDGKKARYLLSKFARLMRQILEYSREEYISIAEEMELLENYLMLEKNTRNDSFSYSINSDLVEDEEEFIPPMLVQPFIENALIHAFKGREDGHINISFNQIDNYIVVSIDDNGVGRGKSAERNAQQESKHKSLALIVTQERLHALDSETDGKIEFIDKMDGNDPIGTTVKIWVPKIQ